MGDSQNSENNKVAEIDLLELAQKIWTKRIFLVKVVAIFIVAGVLIAFLRPKEYTSTIVMVPQSGNADGRLSGLGGLASMAGINLSDIGNDQAISPALYPQIMGNITYQKELLQTLVKFSDFEQPISVYDSYVNDKYKKVSVLDFVSKYTIGLPALILKSLRKKEADTSFRMNFITLTDKEKRAIDVLSDKVNLTFNDKDGLVILSASAPEPLVATQMVIAAQALLQKYITAIKIEKAQQNLDFVQERYDEAKHDYEATQVRLASYQDLNRNIISAVLKTQENKLNNDYNLAFSVYSELAKQLEQAKIQVKDATPVLSVVQPAFVPVDKSRPKRLLIIFAFTFLGIMYACGYVLIKPVLRNLKGNRT